MPNLTASIPEPNRSTESMLDTLLALKANVELLTGQKGPKVSGYVAVSSAELQAELAKLRVELASGGFLKALQNLADLNNVATARTNLGLGSSATKSEIQLLHVQDEKSAATDGGTFTSGAWRTRDLNTVTANQITGASLASNQLTLPAGTYFAQWAAQGYSVNRHHTRLYNITDAASIAPGMGAYAPTPANDDLSVSDGCAYFVLSGTKVLELQHICQSTSVANVGFGFAMNLGQANVYARLTIWKLPT